jgi:Coatomer (COPI) alpha subunit C-terminus
MTELCCFMTLCAMDLGHKFLAFKNAMNNNYKMNNFITAANFARLILELEPTGVRKILSFNNFDLDLRNQT